MKKKDKTIFIFILKEVGMEISPLLEHLIMNPDKVNTLNNMALEKIVNEFAPIYQRYRGVLDGPTELSKITVFEVFLLCRLNNKPELKKVLDGDMF